MESRQWWMLACGILIGMVATIGLFKVHRMMRSPHAVVIAEKILKTAGVPDEVRLAAEQVVAATTPGDRMMARIALHRAIKPYRDQVPDPAWMEAIQPRHHFLRLRHVLWSAILEDESVPASIRSAALDARDSVKAFMDEVTKPENSVYMKDLINDLAAEESAYVKSKKPAPVE